MHSYEHHSSTVFVRGSGTSLASVSGDSGSGDVGSLVSVRSRLEEGGGGGVSHEHTEGNADVRTEGGTPAAGKGVHIET